MRDRFVVLDGPHRARVGGRAVAEEGGGLVDAPESAGNMCGVYVRGEQCVVGGGRGVFGIELNDSY